jgi:hypothetical protein
VKYPPPPPPPAVEVPARAYHYPAVHTEASIKKALLQAYESDPWFQDPARTSGLTFKNEIWYRGEQVVVPNDTVLRQRIVAETHDCPYSGHLGVVRTQKALQRTYHWGSMNKDAEDWVRTCSACQRNKATNQVPAGLLKPLAIPGRRWERVSLDLITAMPKTKRGHDAIVVYVDALSKMTHFAATTTDASAQEMSRLFMHNVTRLHGVPRSIVSDRDGRFISKFWREQHRLLGTTLSMSTSFHPQTDGATERMNRTLEDMLRHFVTPSQDNWDELLDAAEFAVNNAWQASVRNTPFMLNSGQHPLTPVTLDTDTHVPAAKAYTTQLREAVILARKCLEAAQHRQKAFADKRRRDVSYSVGEAVLLNTKNIHLKNPGTRKLLPKWMGPFRILRQVNEVAYTLELPPSWHRLHSTFHVDVLKPYHSDKRVQPPPPKMDVDGEMEFEVETILGHKGTRGAKNLQYLVSWLGYGQEHNSWEPSKNVANSADLVAEYWSKDPKAIAPRGTKRNALAPTELDDSGPHKSTRRGKRNRRTGPVSS